MKSRAEILRGIHPGKIISKDLEKRNLSQREFAASIGEHSQTLNAVIKGHRRLTVEMSLKIEQAFGYAEGMLLELQVYHDIALYKRRKDATSPKCIPAVRRILFWDTDFDSLDWMRYKKAIITRVLERGNESEKCEIALFYGIDRIDLEKYRLQTQNKKISRTTS